MKILYPVFLSLLSISWQPDLPLSKVQNVPEHNAICNTVVHKEVYKVIISEIMADPDPCVLLPDAEYIELYNRCNEAVDISGWKIVFGDKIRSLSESVMMPESYLIICDAEREYEFKTYGITQPVKKMPAIVNTGQTITLKSSSGKVIHSITYSREWYGSSYKKEGGWSLEIIDPDNPCGSNNNWKESANYRGGTPGTDNSVRALNADIEAPVLLRAVPESASSARLLFSENMDSASLGNNYCYSVTQGILHPALVTHVSPDYESVILNFSEQFEEEKRYKIMVLDSLKDCVGNQLEQNAMVDFALPQAADSFDIVVNELLFDATPLTGEFIELYNRSTKTLNLASFSLALADAFDQKIIKLISFRDNPFLLFPDGYVVISSDQSQLPEITKDRWQRNIIVVPDLFTLPDNEGVVSLLDEQMQCIDKFTYSKQMHFNLLSTTEGISLERITAEGNTNDAGNWHSAAESAGYSTPGYQNSQKLTIEDRFKEVEIIPAVFSPDNDGFDDYVTIRLTGHEPGYLASITIFDAYGHKIRTLASNTLLSADDQLIWDGKDENNNIRGIGIYFMFIELYNSTGKKKLYKNAVVLSKRLQ